jgi:hypothetical protein
MPAHIHPSERKIRIWILNLERERQREAKRAAGTRAAPRRRSERGTRAARGV